MSAPRTFQHCAAPASRITRSGRALRVCARKLLGTALVGTLSLSALNLAITQPTQAAVQGTPGATSSTGSVDIDLVLGLRARLTGLADMSLGIWSGVGSMSANDNVCVGSIGTNAPYRIRASGDGAPGNPSAFTLSNGVSTIAYNAWFNDVPNAGTTRQPLTAGVTLTGQTGSNFFRFLNIFGCLVNNANISIEVPETELAGGNGTYTGTLTLLLLPE